MSEDDLYDENLDLKMQCTKLQNQIDDLEVKIDILRDQVNELEKDKERLETNCDSLGEDVTYWNSEYTALVNHNAELQHKVDYYCPNKVIITCNKGVTELYVVNVTNFDIDASNLHITVESGASEVLSKLNEEPIIEQQRKIQL